MRRKILHKAKLVITVESDRCSGLINTISVFDNRTNNYWGAEQIKEQRRGEGRRVAPRPMFRAEQLTDGDRQRRRGAPAPCPDHPAGGIHHRQNSQNRRKSSNQKPKADEMKENLQKPEHLFTY